MSSNDGNNENQDDTKKTIVVEDFQNPTNKWTTLNDPVMGGQSYSNLIIENGVAKFTGKCAIVPSLQAPGFITMETGSQFMAKPAKFPDISSCEAFQLEMKTNTEYAGYRFSFGKAHVKGGRFAYGYKVPLELSSLPPVNEFGNITIPFHKFSDKWNDATGDIEVECDDDPQYCPSKEWLSRMETISFWGEGVEGMVDIEVKSIKAIGCDQEASIEVVAQSMIKSNSHTILSNPFYMASLMFMAIFGCIIVTCLFCCCRCSRVGGKEKKKTLHEPIMMTTTKHITPFKDVDGFHDEPELEKEDNDDDNNNTIELS